MLGDHDWQLDLEAGTIAFNRRHTFPIQVLGTESEISGTWLWAWANDISPIPSHLLQAANQLRTLGIQEHIPEFSNAELALDRTQGHQLAMVAIGVGQSSCYYRCAYDGGAAFVLIDAPDIQQHDNGSASRIIEVFNELISTFTLNHRKAFVAYLKYKEYKLAIKGSILEGVGSDGATIRATFDKYNRLSNISTTIK